MEDSAAFDEGVYYIIFNMLLTDINVNNQPEVQSLEKKDNLSFNISFRRLKYRPTVICSVKKGGKEDESRRI